MGPNSPDDVVFYVSVVGQREEEDAKDQGNDYREDDFTFCRGEH